MVTFTPAAATVHTPRPRALPSRVRRAAPVRADAPFVPGKTSGRWALQRRGGPDREQSHGLCTEALWPSPLPPSGTHAYHRAQTPDLADSAGRGVEMFRPQAGNPARTARH